MTLGAVIDRYVAWQRSCGLRFEAAANLLRHFARKSTTPAGIRLVVDRARIRHLHLAMAGENRLRFAARDLAGNRYRGEFVVRVSESIRGVQLLSGPDPPPAVLEASEAKALPPEIAITSDPAVSRDQRSWRLLAEVRDKSGIQSVAVELNWKLDERAQMRGGFPSRKRGEFRKARRLHPDRKEVRDAARNGVAAAAGAGASRQRRTSPGGCQAEFLQMLLPRGMLVRRAQSQPRRATVKALLPKMP